jgi:hypothetical protein
MGATGAPSLYLPLEFMQFPKGFCMNHFGIFLGYGHGRPGSAGVPPALAENTDT